MRSMAKLTVIAALFIALIAGASAFTTLVDEEGNPGQSCQMEIQQMQMRHCMRWMQTRGQSEVANPRFQEECCNDLRNVSPECCCDAIRRMMIRTQQEYGGMEEEMMRQKAQSLPRMCNMRSPRECHFRAVFA